MADGIGLSRFTLAVGGGAPQPVAGLAADPVAPSPEIWRSRLIHGVADHRPQLAVRDFANHGAAELEVVALLIDRRAAAADDEQAALDAAEEVVETEAAAEEAPLQF